MYTKNLGQLLRLLQASRQSGLLTVESAEQDGATWQGRFWLVEGNVTACQVYKKADGQVLLSNDEAMRWLLVQGKLNWRLEEEAQQFPDTLLPTLPQRRGPTWDGQNDIGRHRTVSPVPLGQPTWMPRRTSKGMQTQARSLGSLEHLQVFTLVNGHNTVEGIARLLRKPYNT
ncbi:MAG TPA: DUF4388 domain-containing protein, partial [Ktedonobacteraceae bacterium]|nr:DUF4388 domain-containing protein [Ktedonobacteraceae bacterium]